MFSQPLVFVDLETTGMRPSYDRIIEIGIVRVENGAVVQTYNQLVNPGVHLPPEITFFSGITSSDLEKAPTFSQIQSDVYHLLDGALFVAHNARFDYAFLKCAFSEEDTPFRPKQLCTVKLSRALFPQWPRHDLSTLIEKMELTCANRHRAYDDAHVLWQFFKKIAVSCSPDVLENLMKGVIKRPSLPPKLDPQLIMKLPECSGVYRFYSEDKTLLYVGKAVNIKERVLSHFTSDIRQTKEMNLARQVADIQWTETAGELGALLLESNLIKSLQPVYNRLLRQSRQLVVLEQATDTNGYLTSTTKLCEVGSLAHGDSILGMFKSKKQAQEYLSHICEGHKLCKKLLGLEKTKSSCFGYQLGTCKGACVGKERKELYNGRFLIATFENKMKPWYFDSPVEIVERSHANGKEERFIVDQWCILQSSTSSENTKFDLDTYKILSRYLKNYYFKGKKRIDIGISIKPLAS